MATLSRLGLEAPLSKSEIFLFVLKNSSKKNEEEYELD